MLKKLWEKDSKTVRRPAMRGWHEIESPCEHSKNFDTFDVIAVEAALCAKSKGILYADGVCAPDVLLFWNESDGFYLSAKEQFDTKAVCNLISKIVEKNDSDEYVLYIDERYDGIVESILPGKYERLDVLGFVCTNFNDDFTDIPEGFEFIKIGKAFFDSDIENKKEVLDNIVQTWRSKDDFISSGFGVAVIDSDKNALASYCVTEHVTSDGAEFSIETMPDYQNRGLATITGKRMLDLCHARSKNAYWYCTSDNSASIRLAEKLGFEQKYDFHVWLFRS